MLKTLFAFLSAVLPPTLPRKSQAEPAQAEPAPNRTTPTENVLIVSFDTVRADHLSCYGHDVPGGPVSPSVDALARSGMRFENCSAPRGETGPSLASLMTGCYPSTHGVMESKLSFVAGVKTLPEYLATRGYDTAAFVAFVPGNKPLRGFAHAVHAHNMNQKAEQSDWDSVAEKGVLEFLKKRPKNPKPFLAWAHFFDVHFTYKPLPPFDTQFSGDYAGAMRWDASRNEARYRRAVTDPLMGSMVKRTPLDPADARYVQSLYDAGIRATDDRLGRIMNCLDELKLRENTLVIFTADHGEDLGEHNHYWFHAASVYESVLHIPLIMSGPGIPPGVSQRIVQNLDVLPTLLEHLNVPLTAVMDGVSFADALWAGTPGAAPRTIAWSEWQDLILGARTEQWKLIVNPKGARPKTPPYFPVENDPGYFIDCFELYDLRSDPHETRNVYDDQRDAIEELRALAAAEYLRRFTGKNVEVGPEDDAAERDEMEQLGYAAGGKERKDVVFDPAACRDR